jgi:cell division septal protein FtsQ
MSHKTKYHSVRFEKRRKIRRAIIAISFLLLSVFLIYGLSYLSNKQFLQIKEIEISQLNFINQDEVKNIVEEKIRNKKYLWLFSKSNSLILPRKAIKKSLKEKYYSIKNIDIDFVNFHKIKIKIIEHDPVAKWCDTVINESRYLGHEDEIEFSSVISDTNINTDDATCYLLSEDGMVFIEALENYQNGFTEYFGLIDGNPLGKIFSNSEEFKGLQDLIKLLKRLNIFSKEIWTKTGEVYVIVTSNNVELFIDSKDDPAEIFKNLEAVIEKDAINEAQFNNIDYIDLRFGNRVFYKLK